MLSSFNVTKLRVPLGRVIGDNNCSYDTFDVCAVELTTRDGLVGYGFGEKVFGGSFAKPVSWKEEMPAVSHISREMEDVVWPELKEKTVEELLSDFPRPWEQERIQMGNYLHAAIRMALWDLAGKEKQLPLAHFLAGDRKPSDIHAYISPCAYPQTTEWVVDFFTKQVAAGFSSLKVKVGNPDLEKDIDRLRRVREAVGPDIEIAVDGNTAWDATGALKWMECVQAEGIGLSYVEDPLWPDNLEGYRLLARESPLPIVGHDYIPVPDHLRPLLDTGAINRIRVRDGIDYALEVGRLAEEYDLQLIQCNTFGEHAVHFAVSHPRLERMEFANIGWNNLFLEPVPIEGGRFRVPETPGLGRTPNPDRIKEWEVRETETTSELS